MSTNKPQRLGDVEEAAAAVAEFEGQIQDVVRKNVTFWRKRPDGTPSGADQVNSLIQRVAGASFDEIDQVIARLEEMREKLRTEGERLQRELSGFADLSHSAMASMKVISESLEHWKQPSVERFPEAG